MDTPRTWESSDRDTHKEYKVTEYVTVGPSPEGQSGIPNVCPTALSSKDGLAHVKCAIKAYIALYL
jgi:hypothetical protein